MKVDLVTGFSGSGKTVWMNRYIRYLSARGLKVRVIENDFSPVGTDAEELKGTGCEIVDLSGVCLRCGGAAKFQNMLIRGARDGCDRLVVESPGIYDAGEFFDTMKLEEVSSCCEIGSIFAVADPFGAEEAFSESAGYLTFTQLFSAGKILISKTDLAGEEKTEQLEERIRRLMEERGCGPVPEERICRKSWDQLTDQELEACMESGFKALDYTREYGRHGMEYESRETADLCADRQDLKNRVERLMTDPVFGRVLRVKGCIQDLEKNWYEVSGFPGGVWVKPAGSRRGICSVVGRDLKDQALASAFLSRKTAGENRHV